MSALFINPNAGGGSVSIDDVTGITEDARTLMASLAKPMSGQNVITIDDSGAAGGIAVGVDYVGAITTIQVSGGIVTGAAS